MKNLKILAFAFLMVLPAIVRSEALTLLEIPMNNGTQFSYVVDLKKSCSFDGVEEIYIPEMAKMEEDRTIVEKITDIQKKMNLVIDENEIDHERITFSIKGAKNLYFEFFFRQGDCKLIKVLHYNEKQFNMSAINIDYSTILKFPVLEKVTIKNENNVEEDLFLYPWALRGQMSLYELNIGPALNVHTNIRLNSKKKFEKSNPVVEPIPAFFFRYGPLFLNKNGMGSLLFTSNGFSILGMGLLEGEPYAGEGLLEREQGIFLGTILKYKMFELTYYNDFFDEKGYNIKLNLAPEFYYRLSWKFSPQAFIQYWDNNYVDYYFGVKPEESASSGFKHYKGSRTLNYGTMFEVMHFRDRWTFVGDVGVKVYGKEVFNSPTVSRSKELRFITSVLYKFF